MLVTRAAGGDCASQPPQPARPCRPRSGRNPTPPHPRTPLARHAPRHKPGGLDFSSPVKKFFYDPLDASRSFVDTVVSLTGFALVGGPARQDAPKAITALKSLNVPYLVALPLVFQTTEEWLDSDLGVHPVQVALQVRGAQWAVCGAARCSGAHALLGAAQQQVPWCTCHLRSMPCPGAARLQPKGGRGLCGVGCWCGTRVAQRGAWPAGMSSLLYHAAPGPRLACMCACGLGQGLGQGRQVWQMQSLAES